jgi:hypothetical protein
MDIYIIKVSLDTSGELDFDPESCEIEPNRAKNLIVWMLDKGSLNGGSFLDIVGAKPHGFEWHTSNPPIQIPDSFTELNLDTKKQHISIAGYHPKSLKVQKFHYRMRVLYNNKVYESNANRSRGKHPVIINK